MLGIYAFVIFPGILLPVICLCLRVRTFRRSHVAHVNLRCCRYWRGCWVSVISCLSHSLRHWDIPRFRPTFLFYLFLSRLYSFFPAFNHSFFFLVVSFVSILLFSFYRIYFLLSSLFSFYIPSVCHFRCFYTCLLSSLCSLCPSVFFFDHFFHFVVTFSFYSLFIFVFHTILSCYLSKLRTFLMQDNTIAFTLLSRDSPTS